MNIIVVGSGRVGAQLAVLLSQNGHNVSVVDRYQEAFRALGRDFNGRTIRGLGFDEDVLRAAGGLDCDVLAAVTDNDNTNLMTTEVARHLFGINHVITRLYNPERSSAYIQLGIDYVCGTSLVSEEMFAKIQSGHGNHLDTFGNFELMTFSFRGPEGKALRCGDVEIPGEVRIVVFEHEGETMIPEANTLLHDGDVVVAAVSQDRLDEMKHYMRDTSAEERRRALEQAQAAIEAFKKDEA